MMQTSFNFPSKLSPMNTTRIAVSKSIARALFAAAPFGVAGVASASCPLYGSLTVSVFEQYAPGRTLILDNEQAAIDPATSQGTPGYVQISSVNAQGAFSGIIVLPSGQDYFLSGTVTQVGSDGLSISFSYNTNSSEPLLGVSYSYAGAVQFTPNCYLFAAGEYKTSYWVPQPKFGVLQVVSGPFPFSGWGSLTN